MYPNRALLESLSMADEGGVLGNLPSARPGTRSAKRDRPAKAAEKAAVRAEEAGKAAADPGRVSKPRSGADRVGTDEDPAGIAGDAVGAVVRGAAGAAIAGAKVAGALTQELFRRLPRP